MMSPEVFVELLRAVVRVVNSPAGARRLSLTTGRPAAASTTSS